MTKQRDHKITMWAIRRGFDDMWWCCIERRFTPALSKATLYATREDAVEEVAALVPPRTTKPVKIEIRY